MEKLRLRLRPRKAKVSATVSTPMKTPKKKNPPQTMAILDFLNKKTVQITSEGPEASARFIEFRTTYDDSNDPNVKLSVKFVF